METAIASPSGSLCTSTHGFSDSLRASLSYTRVCPNVQQGQRDSASEMKRLMLLWLGEKPEGDCCPSMSILSCSLFFSFTANKVYGLQ